MLQLNDIRNIITMNKDNTLITIVINMILMLNITTMFTRMLANLRNIITMNKDSTLINMIIMLNITTITVIFTRMLANLRNMALDMNAEIRDQNEQMDRITEKVKISPTTLLICI